MSMPVGRLSSVQFEKWMELLMNYIDKGIFGLILNISEFLAESPVACRGKFHFEQFQRLSRAQGFYGLNALA
jgi:hypothetical protein